MTPAGLRLAQLIERLVDEGIRFVLVGGLAVNAWGNVRGTRDVDLVPEPSTENLRRLESLLVELGGKVETREGSLSSDSIGTFLRAGDRALVSTALGHVDVLQGLPAVPRFDELERAAESVEIEGRQVLVCSLEHLLAMKRASDRAIDAADVEALEAAWPDRKA